jgi:hypothetical protein
MNCGIDAPPKKSLDLNSKYLWQEEKSNWAENYIGYQ